MKRYRQHKSEIATKAGAEFANRARREAYVGLIKPPAGVVPMERDEELSAIEQFLLDKA